MDERNCRGKKTKKIKIGQSKLSNEEGKKNKLEGNIDKGNKQGRELKTGRSK